MWMANDLKHILERLRGKLDLLTQRYTTLLQEKQAIEERNNELITLTQKQQQEINRLQQEVEYLKVVTTLNPTHKDVEESRAFLSKLVREIDKCIAELNG